MEATILFLRELFTDLQGQASGKGAALARLALGGHDVPLDERGGWKRLWRRVPPSDRFCNESYRYTQEKYDVYRFQNTSSRSPTDSRTYQ